VTRPNASPSDLQHAPQLAALFILDTALRSSVASLEAAHPELHVRAWNPDAPEEVRLAASLCASATALCRLLDDYESLTISNIANDVPW
jgi:hypothetical protein